MTDFSLPRETAAVVDWQTVQAGFSLYKDFIGAAEGDAASERKRTVRQNDIDKAFKKARQGLEKGAVASNNYKRMWLFLGFLAAVVSVVATVVSAAVQNDWSWGAVGGVLLGQGGVIGCCFKFLKYFKGEDAIVRLLAGAEAAFRLARTDEQHDMLMKWFVEEVTRLQ